MFFKSLKFLERNFCTYLIVLMSCCKRSDHKDELYSRIGRTKQLNNLIVIHDYERKQRRSKYTRDKPLSART